MFRDDSSSRRQDYVNHPDDPGGETNLGVTKKVYDAYCKKNGLRPKSMRDLEVLDVAPIYKTEYWDRVKGDDLHPALALCIFDFGVNAGTGRSCEVYSENCWYSS